MKIKLFMIGKTAAPYLDEGIAVYVKRLIHYADFSIEVLPDVKSGSAMDSSRLKDLEAQAFLKRLTTRDFVVLLDENGKQYSSQAFAAQIGKWLNAGDKNVVFVIGGAFGFGEELRKKSGHEYLTF